MPSSSGPAEAVEANRKTVVKPAAKALLKSQQADALRNFHVVLKIAGMITY